MTLRSSFCVTKTGEIVLSIYVRQRYLCERSLRHNELVDALMMELGGLFEGGRAPGRCLPYFSPLKHIKGEWRTHLDCSWLNTADDLLECAADRVRTAVEQVSASSMSFIGVDLGATRSLNAARRDLHWVEGVIVKKLRRVDAAITLQTAVRARRGRGMLLLLGALREIDLRLSRARYAKVIHATRVIQVAWGKYKVHKWHYQLRRFPWLPSARERSARIIQQAWASYACSLKADIDEYRWQLGMLARVRCSRWSADDAGLLFACQVGM